MGESRAKRCFAKSIGKQLSALQVFCEAVNQENQPFWAQVAARQEFSGVYEVVQQRRNTC